MTNDFRRPIPSLLSSQPTYVPSQFPKHFPRVHIRGFILSALLNFLGRQLLALRAQSSSLLIAEENVLAAWRVVVAVLAGAGRDVFAVAAHDIGKLLGAAHRGGLWV